MSFNCKQFVNNRFLTGVLQKKAPLKAGLQQLFFEKGAGRRKAQNAGGRRVRRGAGTRKMRAAAAGRRIQLSSDVSGRLSGTTRRLPTAATIRRFRFG